jgi:site-specific DNA-methyltransferase (adenine-specific)
MKSKSLKVHFSSQDQTWETPQDLFNKIDALHGPFEWDACASLENTKVGGCFFDEEDDGLQQDWIRTATKFWVNPPYNNCKEWIKKAYDQSLQGCEVTCLIPARTDTKYFHDYIMKAHTIYFIKGRLKFGNSKNSAPFPSMIVIFKAGRHFPQFLTWELTK